MTTPSPGVTLDCSYVLPLKRSRPTPDDELVRYLEQLARLVDDVVVVDGSDPEVWEAHHRALPATVRHLPVPEGRRTANGKVGGVLTGVAVARHERIVVADDDVRYDESTLVRLLDLLDRAHLVRPQNYFHPLPWHARWDTARSLLNRALGADYPGTLGVRRSALGATGGYDGDVLFENLELIRTISAAGGTVVTALDLYVARLPPDTGHFLGQRVRQAYDSFATPARLALELSVLPLLVAAGLARRPRPVLAGAAAAVALAERGRRRAGGAATFPPSSSLLAPAWILERAVCSWLAVVARCRGGVRYAGSTLARSATPPAALRRRLAGRLDPLPRVGPARRGEVAAMTAAEDRDDELGQPEPDELEPTDNSTGAVVDDRRLDEVEDEASG